MGHMRLIRRKMHRVHEMHYLHLLNSLAGLALFYTAFNLPFGVYVMRNSFLQVPRDLLDAARVDGPL